MLMKQFSYVLTNDSAMQSRHMGNLVREAARFQSRVQLRSGAENVQLAQARALRDMQRGSRVTVTVEGRDEEAAVAAIQDYFVANM